MRLGAKLTGIGVCSFLVLSGLDFTKIHFLPTDVYNFYKDGITYFLEESESKENYKRFKIDESTLNNSHRF